MNASLIRVLVVDDYGPWRDFLCSALQSNDHFQIVGVVSTGIEAILKTQELQPHLILLDIGLPELNGIEAAHKIRELSPQAKICFVSESRDPEIVEEALRTGARGYVLKSQAAVELLPAIERVMSNETFVSVLASPPCSESD